MKKFVFTLERILAFKKMLYEKERNVLAQLRAQWVKLEIRRENTEEQTLCLDARFRKKAAENGLKTQDITAMNYHRENASKLMKQLGIEMAQVDMLIDKQLQVVVQLDKDVKGLEKLREKQLQEYTICRMKEEQERISEMVSSKYIEDQEFAY